MNIFYHLQKVKVFVILLFLDQLLDNNSISIDSARQPQYLMELCHDSKNNKNISHVHKRLEDLINFLLHQRTENTDLSQERAQECLKN